MRTPFPPTTTGPATPGQARQGGFTLLEVMCAFAILAVTLSVVTQIFAQNIEKAIYAIDQREMRELADTVFGKILFEQQKHRDGDTGSMAEEYGVWAHLPQDRADRYRDYHYSLEKKEYIAAGDKKPNSDAENLFGNDAEDSETSSSSGSSSTPSEGGEGAGTVMLVKFTMRVFRQDEPENNLIVLTRYLRPPNLGVGSTR